MSQPKHALVTGGAGFIGSHLVDALIAVGWRVTVLDYRLTAETKARYIYGDIRYWPTDFGDVARGGPYDVIVHLAARAGVRPSIADPIAYQRTNVAGTQHLLEFAKRESIKQFVFASSSSVYGTNPMTPWTEDTVLQPASPYAATKIAGEALGQVYAHLCGIRFLALRFFTVYGPNQRPDLAIRTFAEKMLNGQPFTMYGDGRSARDYTYVDDIVRGIISAMHYDASSYEVINLGNTHPIQLCDLIHQLQQVLGVTAHIDHQPEQPGDVPITWASIDKAKALLNWEPAVSFTQGLERFGAWATDQVPA
jgi:UDP-glucuronate 4-epimerase